MSYLVNPHGWRLYVLKYWTSNFYIEKSLSSIFMHKSKLASEILHSILIRFNMDLLHTPPTKSFFRFCNYKIFIQNKEIIIMIYYKLYWKSIIRELMFTQNKRNAYTELFPTILDKIDHYGKFFGRWWIDKIVKRSLIKKKIPYNFYKKAVGLHLFNANFKKGDVQELEFNPSGFETIAQKNMFKKLFFFVFFIPVFDYLRKYISISLNSVYKNNSCFKIHFIGLGQNQFDPNHVLEYAEYLINNQKKPSPKRVFYDIIKIMNMYKIRFELSGFKFLLAGRFTRRDRALYLWKTNGAVTLNTKVKSIDYCYRPIILKYGKCIAKLWVCR